MGKNFLLQFSITIIVKLFLEYLYVELVSPIYAYSGFINEFSIDKYIVSWGVYLLGFLVVYKKRKLFISEVYSMLFYVWLLPNTVYYVFATKSNVHFLFLTLSYILIVLCTTNKKIIQKQSLKKGKLFIILISILLTLVVILNYFITTGGKMVLSFKEVYSFREDFSQASNSGLFGYLNSWVSKIFVVVVFAWSVRKRKIILILISLSFIFLLFALSGHKSALTPIFLVTFFYFLFKFNINRLTLISTGFFGLLLLVFILDLLEVPLVSSLIIRRLLLLPAKLNFDYFEFFSENEHLYWSAGIFKSFINNPYNETMPKVIGAYLGHPDMSANTGFIASGYGNGGYVGSVIYVLIVILLYNLINQLARYIDGYFVLSIILPISLSMFVSSDLLTTLLTHGMSIAIMVLWLFTNRVYKIKLGKLSFYV